MSFTDFIENQLNQAQKDAVTSSSGNMLIVAGAGSGKTRVITARIAYLITQCHTDPAAIVALTFTNKAALEMKERLSTWLLESSNLPYVGTFHAYCLFLLRSYSYFLDQPQFSILDNDDQVTLMRTIMKKYNLQKQATPSQYIHQLSQLKNRVALGGKQELLSTPTLIRELYEQYEREKKLSCVLDFDDLLITVLNLFKNSTEFKELYQSQLKHVLIDEYQDTSHIQHALLQEMSLDHQKNCILDSTCVVGDEDQSIYSWRGASIKNMYQYTQDFAPVRIIKIEQNYRSAQSILDTANHLIKHNLERNDKTLWSEKKAAHRVLLAECSSDQQEAQIVSTLLALHKKKNSLHKCAVLYRTHYQSRVLEEELIRASIPYKIIGGIQFYERKEIKDLLAYLWLIINPFDRISFLRVINSPHRGIGQKGEEQLLTLWDMFPEYTFKELLHHLITDEAITLGHAKENALKDFLALFNDLSETTSAHFALTAVLEKTQYINFIRETHEEKEAENRIENIRELVQSVAHFESKAGESYKDIRSFLYEVALLQEKLHDKEHVDLLQLMTLHAAKGLEFELVIITGLEEGVLPNQRATSSAADVEEERRLLYVGITRAQEYLLLLYSKRRQHFGQISAQVPSRFIQELPSDAIQTASFDRCYSLEIAATLEKWLHGSQVGSFKKRENQQSNTTRGISPEKFLAAVSRTSDQEESVSFWPKNSKVYHAIFGPGTVITSEKGPESNYFVTVLFKSGQKKILSTFLRRT